MEKRGQIGKNSSNAIIGVQQRDYNCIIVMTVGNRALEILKKFKEIDSTGLGN